MDKIKKGISICVEGPDGCGKTTLIENLKKEYPDIVYFREPGSTKAAEEIRNLIMTNPGLEHETDVALFAASRIESTKEVRKMLDEGKNVILDRSYFTSLVYQGLIGGVSLNKIIDAHMGKLLVPDALILLYADPEYILSNISGRNDNDCKFDNADKEMITKRVEGYLKLFDMNEDYIPALRYTINIEKNSPEDTLSTVEGILGTLEVI